jgi:hypothetical protein
MRKLSERIAGEKASAAKWAIFEMRSAPPRRKQQARNKSGAMVYSVIYG